ncbi:MAG TPA: GH25 family lysozyme [Mycobacteriales bacterium]|nr:GH25 family lysozyme [Mycobacteriales bacterium]
MRRSTARARPWALLVIAAAGLSGIGAAFALVIWLPSYRPALRPGERYGVDVSAFQGRIDWPSVAGDHIGFAYIKATEGANFVDPEFVRNWAAAGSAGLARGAYHFFSLCVPGIVQARNFMQAVPPDPAALAPALDLELAGNCHARPSAETVAAQLAAFLQAVQAATGRQVVLYLGSDFAYRYPLPVEQSQPLWLRRLFRRPPGRQWVFWQVDGNADVSGITGDVDLDVMRPGSP